MYTVWKPGVPRSYQGGDEDAGIHWCKIDVSVSIEILSIFYTIAALFFYLRLPSSRNDRRALLPHCLCSCQRESAMLMFDYLY